MVKIKKTSRKGKKGLSTCTIADDSGKEHVVKTSKKQKNRSEDNAVDVSQDVARSSKKQNIEKDNENVKDLNDLQSTEDIPAEDVKSAEDIPAEDVKSAEDIPAENVKSVNAKKRRGRRAATDSSQEIDVKPNVEDVRPVVAKKQRGRKVAADSSQVVEVVNFEQKGQQWDDEVVVRCRPAGVVQFMRKTTDKQKTAVESIGFGSLASIKLEICPRQMIRWLCEHFDAKSCSFKLPSGQTYKLTAADVHDVFNIPMGSFAIPISGRQRDSELKASWKKKYTGGNKDITVPLLVNEMKSDKGMLKGNDEFKRCFVMFAMVTLLAPTTNRQADLKLVLTLEDVQKTSRYNWCQYVLDDLCDKLSCYNDSVRYVAGCVLFLQICYFHRVQIQGNVLEDSSLPLIGHWTDELIKERISLENGNYGQCVLDEVTYHVIKAGNAGKSTKVQKKEKNLVEEKKEENTRREKEEKGKQEKFHAATSCPKNDNYEIGRLFKIACKSKIPPWRPITTYLDAS
uniref:Aminotransferase-like plant mobile domain-containing protein n=1 Tax=Chenopodium quinoa TaxID=63459 RepID=A0A803MU09_CHEQI